MNEITCEILNNLLEKKIIPIVIFTENIEDLECQFERNMLAEITNIKKTNYDEYVICFNETNFVNYNKNLEIPDWYNSETDSYDLKFSQRYDRENELSLTFSSTSKLSYYFSLKKDTAYLELIEDYEKSESELNYMDWLQEQVLMLRALID